MQNYVLCEPWLDQMHDNEYDVDAECPDEELEMCARKREQNEMVEKEMNAEANEVNEANETKPPIMDSGCARSCCPEAYADQNEISTKEARKLKTATGDDTKALGSRTRTCR